MYRNCILFKISLFLHTASASRLEWLCDSDSDSESEDLESLQWDNRFSRHHRTARIHGV